MGYNTNEERLLNSSKLVLEESLGKCGGQLVTNSTPITGKFIAITPLSVSNSFTTQGNLTLSSGTTLGAGLTVYGYFTSVTVVTGSAIVYKACE
jgi:hypothetical protein